MVWTRNLLQDFGYVANSPIIIHTDSQSAMMLVDDKKFSNRSKHIDIRYHYIRELVKNGIIQLRYCPTETNIADLMTKPLGPLRTSQLRRKAQLEDDVTNRGGVLECDLQQSQQPMTRSNCSGLRN